MAKKKNPTRKQSAMDDWASSLAKVSTSTETTIMPKEARKEKRAVKKARRQQEQDLKRPPKPLEVPQPVSNRPDPSKRRLKRLALILRSLKNEYPDDRRPFSPEARPIKKKRTLNDTTVQPRGKDYGGIGLARNSLFISFLDPSHVPKLEEEFEEHIPGFFGKTHTKAMKRQLDGNMLWRKMAEQKKAKMPKRLANLSSDQRVQAMIDSGTIM
jgi:hypothetical protein